MPKRIHCGRLPVVYSPSRPTEPHGLLLCICARPSILPRRGTSSPQLSAYALIMRLSGNRLQALPFYGFARHGYTANGHPALSGGVIFDFPVKCFDARLDREPGSKSIRLQNGLYCSAFQPDVTASAADFFRSLVNVALVVWHRRTGPPGSGTCLAPEQTSVRGMFSNPV